MDLSEFEGRAYGPEPWRVAPDAVSDFIDLTGDDPSRWHIYAPPGFAAAALFAVAPELLAELYDRSVVHGEQTFTWEQPIAIDALLEVRGEVTKVRERGGVHFVTFEMTAISGDGPVLTGRSLFLASGESLAAGEPGFERTEPPHSYPGDPEGDQVSASRADLVRYASATRDWNPVHWDHEAGRAAGFPGVVVHGLLQAGWATRYASEKVPGDRPFASARFRFRNALLPARPVDVVVDDGSLLTVSLRDEDAEYLTATLELADE
ncbi:MAG TPA: MaoC/PaaZ C-terminal domain-containing protein [Acidimicrobiia bacterium]|nr:MaoC/PaaZ C-terminal domain-containing protein [Acidimicrobiia bacterium]